MIFLSSSGRTRVGKDSIPFQLPGPIISVRVGLVVRIIFIASERNVFQSSGVSFRFGSFNISKITLSGWSLYLGANCFQTERNISFFATGSAAMALNSCKSSITIRSASRAFFTAQSKVSIHLGLILYSLFIYEKGCRLIRTFENPASLIILKYSSLKRPLV